MLVRPPISTRTDTLVPHTSLCRSRHPHYPKSVCGVIFQGSTRTTGCQFTFTCDGSLARAPVARLWQEAEAIASQALSGRVAPEVGTATHYHDAYVAHRWRSPLERVAQKDRKSTRLNSSH